MHANTNNKSSKRRLVKNCIHVALFLLAIVALCFTVFCAVREQVASRSSQNDIQVSQDVQPGDTGSSAASSDKNNPPSMPTGEQNQQTAQQEPSQEPPQEDSQSGSQGGPQTNTNGEEPPAKPEGDSQTDRGDQTTPPDAPSDSARSEGAGQSGDMQQPAGGDLPMGSQKQVPQVELTPQYSILIVLESLVAVCMLVYLCMSRFNKRSFKEVFKSKGKIVKAVILIIVLTAGISVLCIWITVATSTSELERVSQQNQPKQDITYSAAHEIEQDETLDGGDFTTDQSDQVALMLSGSLTADLSHIFVEKTGDSNGGDTTSFYGTNSALLAKDGAHVNMNNITVTTDATGANGVFCYGGSATTNNTSSDGTTIDIRDSRITTKQDNSGGIMTTGGGTLNAHNLIIDTDGTSSAAIRTDRGGGNVNVDGGTYTTNGKGSPAIYSTANVKVSDASFRAYASEGIVIEGKNSVSIDDCELEDFNTALNGQSTTHKNVFLYQSVSGDAAEGSSEFSAKDSKIITHKGDTFYVTNTNALINLENTEINNTDDGAYLLRVKADSWGRSGNNGGNVIFTLTRQNAAGDIYVDSISTLDMRLRAGSFYEGTINGDNTAKSVSLTLLKGAKIKLTGDSYVSELNDADRTLSNIDFNGHTLYVNGQAVTK